MSSPTIASVRAAWIALVFGIAIGIGIMRSCASEGQLPVESVRSSTKRTVERIPYPVYVDSIRTVVKLQRTYAFIPVGGEDSLQLARAIAMRDSLATLLAAARVRLPFHGDTILADTHDSIDIECDEINKMARLRVRHGLRRVMVDKITDSILTETTIRELPPWSIDVGAGMTISMDGVPRVALYIGISKPLFAIRP